MSLVAARLNGAPAEGLDLLDRGFHYGDGVFRTVRMVAGSPRGWPFHRERLAHDCRRLALPYPGDRALEADLGALFDDAGDGIAKIVVTRGVGGRGYTPPAECVPSRLVLRYPPPAYPAEYAESGVAVGMAETRLARQPALAGIKHLNRLEQVLARRECDARGWPEALVRTDDDRVISGTMSNLFVVRDGALVTPCIRDAGVAGAMRACVMAGFAERGMPVTEADLSPAAILDADEVFLCNSAMPVWPVRAIGDRTFTVGPVSARARAMIVGDDC